VVGLARWAIPPGHSSISVSVRSITIVQKKVKASGQYHLEYCSRDAPHDSVWYRSYVRPTSSCHCPCRTRYRQDPRLIRPAVSPMMVVMMTMIPSPPPISSRYLGAVRSNRHQEREREGHAFACQPDKVPRFFTAGRAKVGGARCGVGVPDDLIPQDFPLGSGHWTLFF
jgi:hypothetical protein